MVQNQEVGDRHLATYFKTLIHTVLGNILLTVRAQFTAVLALLCLQCTAFNYVVVGHVEARKTLEG